MADDGSGFYEALAELDSVEREDPLLAHAYGCLEDFRGAAVELAAAVANLKRKGYSPTAVADHCDLSHSTVRKWMQTGRVFRVPWGTYGDD